MSAVLQGLYEANETMVKVAQNAQKRQKTEAGGGKPYFETVAMKLWEQQRELRKNYDDAQLEAIEVEVRVGMIVDNYRRWKSRVSTKSVAVVDPRANASLRFRAGIDQVFAHKLRSKLAVFTAEPQPLQIMRCDGDDNRWTVSSDGSLLAAERKQALDQVNIALLAHDYDIRLNVATEIADPVVAAGGDAPAPAGPVVNRDAWIVERRKKRTSYSIRDPQMSSWRIDYTEVDIVLRNAGTGAGAGSGKPKKEIELEFELERAVMLDWLREHDSAASIEKTRSLAEQLVRLLDYCLPFESEAEREASLTMVHDAQLEHEIATLNAQVTGAGRAADKGRGKGTFEFLGAMPVNLTRQNLLEVQGSDYFVTEKSDGVRYLLYTVQENVKGGAAGPVAVLVDRAKAVFKFRGSQAVGRALGPGCVLDGELVYNRSFRENVFLVFDALLWRGTSLVAQPFADRLERITREILPIYARGMQEAARQMAAASAAAGQPNLPSNPLQLVRKAFVPKKELGTLLGKMRSEDGERVFFDGEPGAAQSRRHHKSDGLIFQPNAAYQSGRHYDLLKWKWPELRSVDLQVNIPMEAESVSAAGGGDWPIYLMCGGPDNTLINCTKRGDTNVGLGEFDAYRLLADMESPEMAAKAGAGNAIVEVAYDIQIGLWAYLHLRKDKNQPNFIDAVLGVFTEQAEAISIEELQYSLAASAMGLRNDFEARVSKMKEQLLAWQRSELAKNNASANGAHSNGKK